MSTPSPAQVAQRAMAAVEGRQRDDWLGLFADDARLEDPVGHLPPVAGMSGLTQFWDGVIGGLASAQFHISRVWETDTEAMLLATVTVQSPSGHSVSYDGTFNYTVNEQGRIASLRAFWDFPAVAEALTA